MGECGGLLWRWRVEILEVGFEKTECPAEPDLPTYGVVAWQMSSMLSGAGAV